MIESARGGRGLIPHRLRRFIAFIDTPLLCGGGVHSLPMKGARDMDGFGERRSLRFPKSNQRLTFLIE
jgi:hypothetical protein